MGNVQVFLGGLVVALAAGLVLRVWLSRKASAPGAVAWSITSLGLQIASVIVGAYLVHAKFFAGS